MLIGLWLLRPVSDRWAGQWRGSTGRTAPPERLAPAAAPIEPRCGGPDARSQLARSGARSRPGGVRRQAQAEPIIVSSVGRVRPPAEDVAARARRRRRGPAGRRPGADRPRAGSRGRRRRAAASSDLADAEPAAVAEVADERLGRSARSSGAVASSARRCASARSRDVDVVADAGPVGRRVVVAEERQRPARPRRRARTFGMRWVSGSWSSPSALGGAGDVEVAQRHAAQPVAPGRTSASAASNVRFVSPYGLIGRSGASSGIGVASGMP